MRRRTTLLGLALGFPALTARKYRLLPEQPAAIVAASDAPPPVRTYIGLLDPQGSEVTGVGYMRQPISFVWHPKGAVSANEVRFPLAGSYWGEVAGFGIFNASSAGALLCAGRQQYTVAINSGNQCLFAPGAVGVQHDGFEGRGLLAFRSTTALEDRCRQTLRALLGVPEQEAA